MVDDIEVVGEAATGQAALDRIAVLLPAGQGPDVVLMDLLMPGMDGVTATTRLQERHADVAVVAMTGYSEVDRVRSALAAGASGYLPLQPRRRYADRRDDRPRRQGLDVGPAPDLP
jgi:DNA-binding NarL/FixJ family response regulator